MALTQHLRFATNHQPALVVAGLLKDADVRTLLRRLRGRSLTLTQLAPDDADIRPLLRKLRRVNLVTAFRIAGVVKYRARRYPPAVTAALAEAA